jgi:hypothetical protein
MNLGSVGKFQVSEEDMNRVLKAGTKMKRVPCASSSDGTAWREARPDEMHMADGELAEDVDLSKVTQDNHTFLIRLYGVYTLPNPRDIYHGR